MDSPTPSLSDLFRQLGLPDDDASIAYFIGHHAPLPPDVRLSDARFWTLTQARFLCEEVALDADWAPIVDRLDTMLRT